MTRESLQKLESAVGSPMANILAPTIRNTKEGLLRTWAGAVINFVEGEVISIQKDGKELL